jgi:hypothetical protein
MDPIPKSSHPGSNFQSSGNAHIIDRKGGRRGDLGKVKKHSSLFTSHLCHIRDFSNVIFSHSKRFAQIILIQSHSFQLSASITFMTFPDHLHKTNISCSDRREAVKRNPYPAEQKERNDKILIDSSRHYENVCGGHVEGFSHRGASLALRDHDTNPHDRRSWRTRDKRNGQM